MEAGKQEGIFKTMIAWLKQVFAIGNQENQIVIRLSMGSTKILITATVGDGVISEEVLNRMLSVLTEYNKIATTKEVPKPKIDVVETKASE